MLRIFKRKVYQKLIHWKETSNGKTALLIKGARRAGKSTIAEEFAKNEYESFISIDFSVAKPEIIELFDNITDLDFFFLRLQSIKNVTLKSRRSVIIFDEVQMCPKARQAIKHFVKDGRYDYIETGSLLSIRKNIEGIVIPSEETRISMYPLDFEEFLWAIGKSNTFDLIRYSFENRKPLGQATNRALMRDFRLFILVGGMPQAVNAYVETNDFRSVDDIKRSILELYIYDFMRIDKTGRASTILKSIPSQLARHTSRYAVGAVVENARPSRLSEVFSDIGESMVVSYAYRCTDPNVGMPLNSNPDDFKMYLADTGLFVTLAFMEKDYTENDLYRRLFADKLEANLGYIYENAVAQLLRSAGHMLYYYMFNVKSKAETTEGEEKEVTRSYEIDFLTNNGNKVCPIEVKSSGYKTHASLTAMQNVYSSYIGQSYLLYTKDLKAEDNILFLPAYMASLL